MKKFYSFVLLAVTLLLSTNIWANDVSTLEALETALGNGGEITLTGDITTSETLNITKSVIINGAGHSVTGSAQNVFSISTGGEVTFNNIKINATQAGNDARAIAWSAAGLTLTLDGVDIKATGRGINDATESQSSIALIVKNSTISCIGTSTKGKTLTENDYDTDYNNNSTRGISLSTGCNQSEILIENTTIQGFSYEINVASGTDAKQNPKNMTLTANNCTFKGRAALNVSAKVITSGSYSSEDASNNKYTFSDCSVLGINNQGGQAEGFGCFVFDGNQKDLNAGGNTLTINGGTVVSVAFDGTGDANTYAREFLICNRGDNNNITINNAQYICPKTANGKTTNNKGGILGGGGTVGTGNITIKGGKYDCPELVEKATGNSTSIDIRGGYFDLNIISEDMTYVCVSSKKVRFYSGTFAVKDQDIYSDYTNIFAYTPIKNQNGTISVVPSNLCKTNVTFDKSGPLTGTSAKSNVIIKDNAAVTVEKDASVYRLDMAAGTTLTVKNGCTLTIGVNIDASNFYYGKIADRCAVALQNSDVTGSANPSIIVEAGGKVILNGLMYDSDYDNLILKMDENSQAQLLINPNVQVYGENHPKATVELTSKSYLNGSKQVWQRFGIPAYAFVSEMTCNDPNIQTFIYEPDYTASQWKMLGKLGSFDVKTMNRPFVCYDMACNAAQGGTQYTMKAELMGNGNVELPAVSSWNYFANSYTAALNIEAMINEYDENGTIDPTVYVYKITGPDTYTWEPVNMFGGVFSEIAPMQAYIVRNTAAATTTPLKFKEMVWTPASTPAKVSARQNAMADMTKVRIVVTNEAGAYDNVVLGESTQFSENYDRGYDAVKYMNEDINIYVLAEEKQSIFATDNLDDTYIGFSCVNAGKYTVSFPSVQGEGLFLVDLFTNTKVQIAEGMTYEFEAAANTTNDRRFVISKRPGVLSEVENIAAPQATGIYNMMGQYLGETTEWNNLPSGVYIINGKKQVK